MIAPRNEPSMVTFRVPGWDGVAICPTFQSVPAEIGYRFIHGDLEALWNWLPTDIGQGLRNATGDQTNAFLDAWQQASGVEPEEGPRSFEAGNPKAGMTVAELAEFCADAEHLADQPVTVSIGWRGQIQRIEARP